MNITPPLVFNLFKPTGMTSQQCVRLFKRNLPKDIKKIGHFGTLDPFACGVLLVGIEGAMRLNELVHEYLPKTYLSVGKLGVETPTGDLTSEVTQTDQGNYLKEVIAKFDKSFIAQELQKKFLGHYMQAPHAFSAAKFQGRPLYEYARSGQVIKKEKKQKEIFKIEVVKYEFPYLVLRTTVSSGTYIRTLFAEMANHLGTIGTLVSLVRESVGHLHMKDSLKKSLWNLPKDFLSNQEKDIRSYGLSVEEVLPFQRYAADSNSLVKIQRGQQVLLQDRSGFQISSHFQGFTNYPYAWVRSKGQKEKSGPYGLANICSQENSLTPCINFPQFL